MRTNTTSGWGSRAWRSGRPALLGVLLFAGGCYPGDGPSNIQDLDVVVTTHSRETDFASFASFAMPDSVVHIDSEQGENIIDLPRDHDDLILELAAENMVNAGYRWELDPETNGADLVLLVAVVGTERTNYWYGGGWWGWWGWWPGWGYPGYPGYNPGWGWYPPPYVGKTTWENGTILLTLLDPDQVTVPEKLPVIWGGAGHGILSESGSGAVTRITDAINQMFTQSPYLGR